MAGIRTIAGNRGVELVLRNLKIINCITVSTYPDNAGPYTIVSLALKRSVGVQVMIFRWGYVVTIIAVVTY